MDKDIKNNILKTGTSLVGITTKDGVVMAGDRKSTLGGQIVFTKDSKKVVAINNYIVISRTGVASDIELAKKLIRAELKLKELRDKKRPTIHEVANLIAMMSYKNIRQPSMIPSMTANLSTSVIAASIWTLSCNSNTFTFRTRLFKLLDLSIRLE